MGNRVKPPVEAVETYCLKLDTGHHLDLLKTPYVPCLFRNLVSLSKLDVTGYSLLILVMDVSIYLSIIISLVLVFFVMVYKN